MTIPPDYAILISLALTGILDANLERYTGRGLIERANDFLEHLASLLSDVVASRGIVERRRR